eukprot:TRINITY_DN4956_c0_g2_i15.p1 TRINITY_DN4956_c0_g2~~TRINITY_DN4956_c0_g2_i15.p1  ORF type:complete len:671 (-),score=135.22 TRINITY_DN4956_c0_g2_i15:615-2627(-)
MTLLHGSKHHNMHNSRWVYLIQVASEKASELDAIAVMDRGKKRKHRLTDDGGDELSTSRAIFGQEDKGLVQLIMQRYELLLGLDDQSKASTRRPRKFVGSVVRQLLDETPGVSRYKSIDRARVFECRHLPPGSPLEPLQEHLVETTWDHETGLPHSCERLTGRSWLCRSVDQGQAPTSCLLAQPQRPVDGGEFHFKLSSEDDEIVAYWCKSRAAHYVDWEVPNEPEPKPERRSAQPAWDMCGVISQRGLPCPQRKESCPYHRRGNRAEAATPNSPRSLEFKEEREICGVMSQRGLVCPQKKGSCPYHSAHDSKSKQRSSSHQSPRKKPREAAREEHPPESEESEEEDEGHGDIDPKESEERDQVSMDVAEEEEEEQQQQQERQEQQQEQEQEQEQEPTKSASPGVKKQGTQIDLVTAACNFMVNVTEVDDDGSCLLGWSYPPGCARDAGALLALSLANHWHHAKLPCPLNPKMWREELASGARKHIGENTGMGICAFTASALARVNDGKYVFVLLDSSSAHAVSQPVQVIRNKVVSIVDGRCRMSEFNQVGTQRRRSRPTEPVSKPPAATPKAKRAPSLPTKRAIKNCPSGSAEKAVSGRRKSHHSEWELIGARFRKRFAEHGNFEGVVLRDDGHLGFLVKYASDSDVEHIDAGELLDLVHRFRSSRGGQ